MHTIEALDKKIAELKTTLTSVNEKSISNSNIIREQVDIVQRCISSLTEEKAIDVNNYLVVLKIAEDLGYTIDGLEKIINNINNVFIVSERIGLNVTLTPTQNEEKNLLLTSLVEIKEKLNIELQKAITSDNSIQERIDILEELKNILEGKGRKKYYSEEMFKCFCEEFKVFDMPVEEVNDLFEDFWATRNIINQKVHSKANPEEVKSLFKEYLSLESFSVFEMVFNKHDNEIISEIDLDNAREILDFFKEKGILERFNVKALTAIALYGNADYIKETVYPTVMDNNAEDIKTYFGDDLATVWIVKEPRFHKSTPYRTRKQPEGNDEKTLYHDYYKVSYKEIQDNMQIIKENANLIKDGFYCENVRTYVLNNGTRLHTWELKKKIELCKLFGLGVIHPIIKTVLFQQKDIEENIHWAIELGLLKSPLTKEFRLMDKDIVKNENFERNVDKKNIFNHSIRNYFERFGTGLYAMTWKTCAFMFNDLYRLGYIDFYNDFFSDQLAGMSRISDIINQAKNKVTEEFIDEKFVNSLYSDIIPDYDLFDYIITEYSDAEKRTNYDSWEYFDSTILEDPLIKELEEKNAIKDIITQNGETKEIKNEFIYMFGDRIISRYKVLRNASILKKMNNHLTKDMLITSIVRDSFLDEKSFEIIYSEVMERGRK